MSTASNKVDEPRIVNAKALQFLGFSKAYKARDARGFAEQWEKFAPHIGKIPGQSSRVAYGIMFDSPGGLEYMTAVEAPANAASNSEMKLVTLPAGKYAAFKHQGNVSTMSRTVNAAYDEWLPSSGHDAAARPKFIERYGEKFDPVTGSGDIEVWIPLKP